MRAPLGKPGPRVGSGRFVRAQRRASLLVFSVLSALGPWTFPIAPDGLLVLRTAEAIAFEGTLVLPPAQAGAQLHPWFFRPAPGDGPGVVSVYQPLSSVWRAIALRAVTIVPEGKPRGRAADFLLSVGPIAFTALTVFPLCRLLRYGGIARGVAPWGAAAVVLGSFLGPLGTTDFSEPLLVLFVTLALERALRSSRRLDPAARLRDLALGGLLAALANLVKPVAFVLAPALLVPVLFPRRPASRARLLAALAGGAAPGVLLFLWAAYVRTGRLLEVGYGDQPLGDVVSPLWTLLRITLLPNRGLIFLAPLSLLALWGLPRLLRSRPRRADGLASLLGFGGFFALNVVYWAWEGGMGWSPRYLAPALPLLGPALGAGGRRFPRAAAALIAIGFLVNLPGFLLDPDRVYRVTAAELKAPEALGPLVPLHRDPSAPDRVHPIQRAHYVPSRAAALVAPRILFELLTKGESAATGAPAPGRSKDALLLRLLLAGRSVRDETTIGRLLYEEALISAPVDAARGLRFVLRSLRFGGPPVDARALGSYLALVLGRPAEAERLAREGLALDPSRADLAGNLALARAARTTAP